MNDQTHDETPGSSPSSEVPLKRDRQRLRSSEPWPPPVMPASTEPDAPDAQHAAPSAPAKRRFGLDFLKKPGRDAESEAGEPLEGDPQLADPQLIEPQLIDPLTAEPVPEGPGSTPEPTQTVPYLPPGGFTGPGHPRLGPLAPTPVEKHSGLAGLDIAAMVAAIIVPPVGLVTAIVALIQGKRLRGWASDLARAAVSVSLVMTLVFVGVGGFIWVQETERAEQLAAAKAAQRAHDRVADASAPFCEVLAANPTIYSTADPDYGWPAVDAPEGYNAAIANYSAAWAQIAAATPEGIAEETAAISQRIAGIVNIANALGSQNRAGDLLGLHAETDLATVESWYVDYCDAPEIPEE